MTLAEARRWYAEDLRAAAPVTRSPAVVEAFATVPRERFLGPGPWQMHARLTVGETYQSPSADPRHLYHDLLVSIDDAKGINNGMPSLWARVFDALDLRPGATVMQVGTGLGYFTAILAELVGPDGRVIAYEVEAELATRAQEALHPYSQVTLHHGDATQARALPVIDALVASAGVTHVPPAWLGALRGGGRMMVPLTGQTGWGFLMLLTKGTGQAHALHSLGPCGCYPCLGARDESEAKALGAAPDPSRAAAYRTDAPPADGAGVWVKGRSHWIAQRPDAATGG